MSESCFTYQLDPEPAQVSHAREQVRKTLLGWGLAERDDLAELIVSELVTNALRHTASPITVRLSCNRGALRIEVSDNADDMPVLSQPGDDDETGRGLQLISALITLHQGHWGITRHHPAPGKTIYACLPSPRAFVRAESGCVSNT